MTQTWQAQADSWLLYTCKDKAQRKLQGGCELGEPSSVSELALFLKAVVDIPRGC